MGGPCIAPQEGQGQDTARSGGGSPQDHRDKDPGPSLCSAHEQKRGHLQHQTMTRQEDRPGFSALSIL